MVAIISICHKGTLEIETAFQIYTIRKYLEGNYNIYIGIPEQNIYLQAPSTFFIDFCQKNDVSIFSFKNDYIDSIEFLRNGDLNSNKLFLWQKKFKEDFVVFMDSDTMILRSFNIEKLVSDTDVIKLKLANRLNIFHWKELYSRVGIPFPEQSYISSIDRKQMPPYFNSGVIVFNRKSIPLISKYWKEYYLLLSDKQTIQEIQFPMFHRDQIALAFSLMKMGCHYCLLDESYNFPMRGKRMKSKSIPFIVHYHEPSTIYFEPLLYREFKEFIIKNKHFIHIAGGLWARIYTGNIFYKMYILILEEKRIFRNWFDSI